MDLGAIKGAINNAGGLRDNAIDRMSDPNADTATLMEAGIDYQEAQIAMDTISKSANQALKAAGDALKDSIDKSA